MTKTEAIAQVEKMIADNNEHRKQLPRGEDYNEDKAECHGEATGLRVALYVLKQISEL